MSDIHCTTRFCSTCQTETTRNANGRCKPCKRAYNAARYGADAETMRATSAAYRDANREKVRTDKAAYYAANVAVIRVGRAAYRAANLEIIRTANAAYRAANLEIIRTANAAYYAANQKNRKAYNTAYSTANPEVRRIGFHNYEAKKRANGGTLSKGLSDKLFKLQQGKCPCCNEPLGENYHLDHSMPLRLGGPNVDSNMQLLRQVCNLQKSAQHPIDFMQRRGFLL